MGRATAALSVVLLSFVAAPSRASASEFPFASCTISTLDSGSITIALGGTATLATVPAGVYWDPLSVHLHVVAGPAVGTRELTVKHVSAAGKTMWSLVAPGTQTAGVTRYYSMAPGMDLTTRTNAATLSLPTPVWQSGSVLQIGGLLPLDTVQATGEYCTRGGGIVSQAVTVYGNVGTTTSGSVSISGAVPGLSALSVDLTDWRTEVLLASALVLFVVTMKAVSTWRR